MFTCTQMQSCPVNVATLWLLTLPLFRLSAKTEKACNNSHVSRLLRTEDADETESLVSQKDVCYIHGEAVSPSPVTNSYVIVGSGEVLTA